MRAEWGSNSVSTGWQLGHVQLFQEWVARGLQCLQHVMVQGILVLLQKVGRVVVHSACVVHNDKDLARVLVLGPRFLEVVMVSVALEELAQVASIASLPGGSTRGA